MDLRLTSQLTANGNQAPIPEILLSFPHYDFVSKIRKLKQTSIRT